MSVTVPSARITESIAAGVAFWLWVVVVELLLIVGYFVVMPGEPTNLRYAFYPFVWINIGVWATIRVDVPSAAWYSHVSALSVAGLYFVLLAYLAGLIGFQPEYTAVSGLQTTMASPGWGPIIVYAGTEVYIAIVPYLTIGYLSLTYLVYATLLETVEAATAGVFGFVSCVGCTFPVITSLVAGVGGGSSAVTAVVYSFSIDISTFVFVFAVALLYGRLHPGYDSRL